MFDLCKDITTHWSKDNTFRVLKLIQEKQVVRTARKLAAAIKDNKLAALPARTYLHNIEKLYSLFNQQAELIINKILVSALRVKVVKNTDNILSPKVNKREQATEAPRVNIVKDDGPPKLVDEEKEEQLKPIILLIKNNKHYYSNVSKASDEITLERAISKHKYPTRSKVPIIAN